MMWIKNNILKIKRKTIELNSNKIDVILHLHSSKTLLDLFIGEKRDLAGETKSSIDLKDLWSPSRGFEEKCQIRHQEARNRCIPLRDPTANMDLAICRGH